jgi:hypothetical protein
MEKIRKNILASHFRVTIPIQENQTSMRCSLMIASLLFAYSLGVRVGTAGTVALDFTAGTTVGGCGNPGGCTFGWSFHVNSAINVDALGVWDETPNGLSANHDVGLWTSGGALIASATVTNVSTPVSSSSGDGRWLFTSIAVTPLVSGDYVIGAFYTPSGNDVLRAGSAAFPPAITTSTIPQITFTSSENTGGGGALAFPGGSQGAFNPGFFGPNLQASVPEPSPVLLLAAGLAVLAIVGRRPLANAPRRPQLT